MYQISGFARLLIKTFLSFDWQFDPMSFLVNYSKKYVQKVKILSLYLYYFIKMRWFNLALQQSKV